jgi:hypothetical protein
MKKLALLLFFVALCGAGAFAQNTIIGTVVDTTDVGLPGATVMAMNTKDSSLLSFSLTDGQGKFEVQRVPKGDILLRVTYIGYGTKDQILTFPENRETRDLGAVKLLPQSELIDELTVTGERNPIAIKKDTVEFNANSFRTQPNAVVEDLLQQLPGVEVDRDGGVKAQGEDVQRVLVDGKEFFGRDPKIATKNLPADAVETVQVYDRQSDQAEFTGIDDGQREKTINLKLKEDKKKGAFGNMTAGYGDAGRFVGKATINSFNKNTQLSFIGTGNNINEQGFSLDDYQTFSSGSGGGGGRFRRGGGDAPLNFGNAEGIATTYAGGLNFNHEFTEETELNLSYFYSRFDKLTLTDQFQQTFLREDAGQITDDFTNRDDLNSNHALNLRFESELDSMSSVLVRGTFGYNATESITAYTGVTTTFEEELLNTSDQNNFNEGNILRGNGSVLYRRKFAKGGRNFSANLEYGLNNRDAIGNNTSSNLFYDRMDGTLRGQQIFDQETDQFNDNNSYSASVSYTEPLGKRRYLEFNYEHSKNQTDLDRAVFDVETGARIFNNALSNLYRVGYTYNNAGMNFVINRPSYNLTVGATVQNSVLDGELLLADQEINQTLTNVLPKLNFRYNFASTKNLTVDYSTNVIEPTVQQLQPFPDISDPLRIYEGNPELRPEFRHNIRTRLFSFNPGTFTNFFGNLTFTYSANKIRNNQIIEDNGVRITRPENVDFEYSTRLFLNYGSRINNLQIRYNIGPNVSYSRGVAFVNGLENDTRDVSAGMRLRFDNQKKEKIDVGIGGNFSYTTAQFSIAENQNQSFINHSYFADLTVTLIENKLNINSELDYSFFNGLSDDFNQQIPIWRAELSLFMLKNSRGQLKVGVYDILNQNRGVSRINQLNFIVDREVNALGRYFLTTFTYSLKGFQSDQSKRGSWRGRK